MSASPDDLRQEMARIRAGARGKAFQLKKETQQLLDWKHYIRLFPWGILGSALLAGYLLVPTRRSAPREVLPQLGGRDRSPRERDETDETVKKAGLATAALGFVGSFLYRAGVNYAMRQAVQMVVARTPASSASPQKESATHDYDRSSFR